MIDETADHAPYRVRLFGALGIDTPDGLPATPRGRKVRALLAYLILAEPEAVGRELLAGLLWSERGEEQARASLRQALYEIRRPSSGSDLPVIFDRTSARVVAGSIDTDVARLRHLGDTTDAVALALLIGDHPRPLLADLDGVDPAFDDWLTAERVRRGDERRGIVLATAERALAAGDAPGAYRLATRLLAADAVDEVATRIAMAASHQNNDRHGIRQCFGRLELALRRDLGAAPAAETVALYRQLMSSAPVDDALPEDTADAADAVIGQTSDAARDADHADPIAMASPPRFRWMPGPGRAFARPLGLAVAAIAIAVGVEAAWPWSSDSGGQRVLLVEPLQVASGDGAAQALKAGLSTDLARMIVGNGAALSVSERAAPSGAVRSDDLIVTGDAESSDGVLHADIKLLDHDATIFWAHAFTRPVHEVDAMREEMASKVADVTLCALGSHNSLPGNLDLETTRLFLAACEQKHGDWDESIKLLKQVVARRPGFAHGWAMLSAATASVADERGDGSGDALRRQADAFALRALALNPNEGEAYYARAMALPGIGNWTRRMDILRAGHAVDPTNSVVNVTIAWNLALVGRSREAIDYARQAVAFDPFNSMDAAYLAMLVGFSGDLFGAADILDAVRSRFPLDSAIGSTEFSLAALSGDPRQAMELMGRAGGPPLSAEGAALWRRFIAARVDPSARNVDEAQRAISAGASDPRRRGLGAIEKLVVIGPVETAYTAAASLGPGLKNQDSDKLFRSTMAPFRADPRFMTVASRLGLAQVWVKTGVWPDFCNDQRLPYDCRTEARTTLSIAEAAKRPQLARVDRVALESSRGEMPGQHR